MTEEKGFNWFGFFEFVLLMVIIFFLGYFVAIWMHPPTITSTLSSDSRISMCLGKYMSEIHIVWNHTSQVYDTVCVNPRNGNQVLFSFGVVSP